MKRIYLLMVLVLCLLMPTKVMAKTGSVYCPDDNEPLTIRSSVGGAGIASATCNSKINIVEENVGKTVSCSNWHKVEYNGKTGYACGLYIKVDNSQYEVGTTLCIEDTSPLNIWKDTNKSAKLKSLNCGTKMSVIEKNVASNSMCSNWYKVEYEGVTGYACGKYIGIEGSSSGGSNNPDVGKSTGADNTYIKDNYKDKVNGDGTIACFENTGDVTLRSTVGSGSSTGKAKCGEVVKINSIKENSGICKYYYNVTNERNETGYLCGYFVNTTKLSTTALNYYGSNGTLDAYTASLKALKFPDSYIPYLLEIHARHPNWKFVPEFINLDFNEVVANEAYVSRSLLEKAAFNENYYSMGLNSYDILNNNFITDAHETNYIDASTEAIAYYLDPRNYLNEKYIFGFESLLYNASHDSTTISKMMNQSYWPSVYSSGGSVGADIVKASKEVDVSATHIASRIRQEIGGISASDMRLGGAFTYDGRAYSGYYNFFNIDVWGENKLVRGMKYAMDNGWNTPYKAIYGGSAFIRNNYIAYNQDTIYYEKFDVSTNNGHYTHQYQQNLAAVAQETNLMYSSYYNMDGYFGKEITFMIPVYNNMSNYAVTAPRLGNPNNYLKDLTINGRTIDGFNYDKYTYDITMPASVKTMNVGATKVVSDASVKGIGNANIANDTTIKVVVTAESGKERIYQINVKKEADSDIKDVDMNTILNNIGVKYNDKYMFGIKENTNVAGIIDNVKKISPNASVTIKDKNGNANSGVFKTGDIVTISNTKETRTFTIVIYGDINGDGAIDKLDYLAVLRHYYKYTSLSGVYKEAADANHDGKIDKLDYLAILRDYYNYAQIVQ